MGDEQRPAGAMRTVRRYDQTEPIGEVTSTPAGGRRVAANLSRVGVFRYQYADGSVVREYRPPSEVLAPEAVASFRGAPVTWLHPDGGVSPANFREVVRGHVLDTTADAPFMAGALDVNDPDLIARVDAKEATETSCGYTADCDPTPGVTADGEEYDAVQRNIRGNHVALGPRGWGRQGPTVALRLDSASAIGISVATATRSPENKNMALIKIDGIECEAGSATHLSILEKQRAETAKRADDAEARVTSEKKRADDAEKALVTAKAETAAEKKRADDAAAAAEPKALAKRIADRVFLVTLARTKLGPKYLADADGAPAGEAMAAASDDDIIKAVLAKLAPALDVKSMDHAMLMGALLALCSQAADDEAAEPPMDSVTQPAGAAPPSPADLQPGAYDSKNAPRGRIGEQVTNPNMPSGGGEKTQDEALRARVHRDSVRWKATPVGAFVKPQPGAR